MTSIYALPPAERLAAAAPDLAKALKSAPSPLDFGRHDSFDFQGYWDAYLVFVDERAAALTRAGISSTETDQHPAPGRADGPRAPQQLDT